MLRQKGFTLIELIVVIIIIGVLASIAAPMMAEIKNRAMLAEAETVLGHLRSEARAYYTEHQKWPFTGAALNDPLLASLGAIGINDSSLGGTYFGQECYGYAVNPVFEGWIAVCALQVNNNIVNTSAPRSEEARGLINASEEDNSWVVIYLDGRFEYRGIRGKQ